MKTIQQQGGQSIRGKTMRASMVVWHGMVAVVWHGIAIVFAILHHLTVLCHYHKCSIQCSRIMCFIHEI